MVLAAALVVGACNGGGGPSVDNTLPPPVETTSTTAVDYSVPAVIDAAYVEKVMAALDRVYGDAIRTLAAERQITEEFLTRLAAIYGDAQFDVAQRAWVRDVADGLDDLHRLPGDPLTVVQRTVRLDADCIVAAVERTFRAVREPVTSTPQKYIALVPKPEGRDMRSLNPTPWIMSYDGFVAEPAGAEPANPCSR
ncbi:MAG: hypothetical protein KY443_07295 [Actinobacteria bacterium]|nr:hypothetical protein [Actinomycetota bacterium]